jgi:hypothetical protein
VICIKLFRIVFWGYVFSLISSKLFATPISYGVQFFVPTLHLSDNAVSFGDKYSYRLDDEGRIVALPGIKSSLDIKLSDEILGSDIFRAGFAYYRDCMDQESGVLHFGLRWTLFEAGNFNMDVGLGPTLFYRKSWNQFSFYYEDGFLVESDDFLPGYQHRFLVFGDFDLKYKLNEKFEAIVSIIPAFPYVLMTTAGLNVSLGEH